MKKQTFYKQKQLKSQKSFENLSKNNNFNIQDYSLQQIKNIDKEQANYNNRENKRNWNNRNNINKSNINIDKKGKIGNLDYEIEPRNIYLFPENCDINEKNLKLSEKELLPKEKNYFISEKNFQLIKDTLNEKEEIIKELNDLLEKSKNENKSSIFINQNNAHEKLKVLEEENEKLEKANNELILQIEKKNIYFNKIYQLLKFVFKNDNIQSPEIIKFIKEQDLEILFNLNEFTDNKNNNKVFIDLLFKTNKDMIMNELENYKKKYNDVRKQLNYITNMKYYENENEYKNDNEDNKNKIIVKYQKKINELYLSNQNYIKENAYLKLLCQNNYLEKQIKNENNNNDIMRNKLKEKEKYIQKLENINSDLEKDVDLLKNDKDSLLKMINQIKTNLNNNKEENDIKNKQILLNYDKIKNEKEKLEKLLNNYKLKEDEENMKIKILTNKNELLINELNLEKNRIQKLKSCFENLVIENGEKLIYLNGNCLYNYNLENELSNNNYKMRSNINNNKMNIQKENLDLLMLLYNKSKHLEQYINND